MDVHTEPREPLRLLHVLRDERSPNAEADDAVKPSRARRPVPSFDATTALLRLEAGKTTRDYRAREVVYAQGDPADAVFYVESGQVTLTVVSSAGKVAVIAVLGDGTFFGEACLTGQTARLATASADRSSTVARIGKTAMVDLLRRDPEFAGLFTAYLLSRNVRIEADLVDQLFNSSEKRLARMLLLLAHFGKDSKSEVVIPKITQETLARSVAVRRNAGPSEVEGGLVGRPPRRPRAGDAGPASRPSRRVLPSG